MSGDSAAAAATSVCIRSIELMVSGTLDQFAEVIHPRGHNREARSEPLAARGVGPAAFLASAQWLRAAYADLAWEVHDVVAEGDVVALHTTMTGRQVGSFVVHGADGAVSQVFPASNRAFEVTQTHWFRLAEGLVIEHWANRDDFGQAEQLGWIPPSPPYLARMLLATWRAKKLSLR